jgi:hypothetical protein
LISESDDGVSVAVTRQKAGRRLNCWTAAGLIPGGVKPPAGTGWARVIDESGRARDDKVSHDAAALTARPAVSAARSSAHDPPMTVLIAPSSDVLRITLIPLLDDGRFLGTTVSCCS